MPELFGLSLLVACQLCAPVAIAIKVKYLHRHLGHLIVIILRENNVRKGRQSEAKLGGSLALWEAYVESTQQ